jgi:transposase-like protein
MKCPKCSCKKRVKSGIVKEHQRYKCKEYQKRKVYLFDETTDGIQTVRCFRFIIIFLLLFHSIGEFVVFLQTIKRHCKDE